MNFLLDNGNELDHENIRKLMEDEMIMRGDSIFDHKVFDKIKEHVIGSARKRFKDGIPNPPSKKGIDVNKELKKFSPIELDWVKDKAIQKETTRILKLERFFDLHEKTKDTPFQPVSPNKGKQPAENLDKPQIPAKE